MGFQRTKSEVKVRSIAPDFTLPSQSGQMISLKDFIGEKHSLPFTLLSDEGGKVRKLYGVPNTFGIFPGRVTYIIDKEGVVRRIFSSQLGVEKHAEEAFEALRSIS